MLSLSPKQLYELFDGQTGEALRAKAVQEGMQSSRSSSVEGEFGELVDLREGSVIATTVAAINSRGFPSKLDPT